MEVSRPVINVKDRSYTFKINCTDVSKCCLRSRSTSTPSKRDISGVVTIFAVAASEFFPSSLDVGELLDQVHNEWKRDDDEIDDWSFITWIPSMIKISPIDTAIDWVIHSIDAPGQSAKSKEHPGKAAIYRRRIREARLKAAAAELHAANLVEGYYRKYGQTLLNESDSSLSEWEDVGCP